MPQEIGWNQESKLLEEILKKLKRITEVMGNNLPTTTSTTTLP